MIIDIGIVLVAILAGSAALAVMVKCLDYFGKRGDTFLSAMGFFASLALGGCLILAIGFGGITLLAERHMDKPTERIEVGER